MNRKKPKILILGPGGVKGLLILGCMKALENFGLLSEVRTLCGVSIGSIISSLFILGYTIQEIITFAINLNLSSGFDLENVKEIYKGNGLLSHNSMRNLLKKLFSDKGLDNPSLKKFFEFSGKKFISVAYNITDENTDYFSYKTKPEMSTIDAILASMSIPLVYQNFIIDGKIYVDGALGNCYPVDYFVRTKYPVLGIYIKTEDKEKSINKNSYLHKLIQAPMSERRKLNIFLTPHFNHICLISSVKDSTGISISLEEKCKMLISGYNIGMKFIENFLSK